MKDFDQLQAMVYFLELSLHALEASQNYARQHKLNRDVTQPIAIVRQQLKLLRIQQSQLLEGKIASLP